MAGRRMEGSKVVGMHPRDDRTLSGSTISGSKTDDEIIAEPAEDHVQYASQMG